MILAGGGGGGGGRCGKRDRSEGKKKRRQREEEKKIDCLCDCLPHDACNVVCLKFMMCVKFYSMLCMF